MFTSLPCPRCGETVERKDPNRASERCDKCRYRLYFPPAHLESGTMIAGFRLERVLGCGAMGHVFEATQVAMDRKVAFKILSPEFTSDANALDRFLREARLSAKLDHPNIVTAFDAGSEDKLYYLAIAFVEGRDLQSLLQERKTLDQDFVLEVMLRVAEALEYVWNRHKLLHRDIKPANVMVDESGAVKLMDMGISKSLADNGGKNVEITQGIVGTPYYMSPEQASAPAEADFRADMYALGATAYHCLTGERPFDGKNALIVMTKHAKERVVPPQAKNPNITDACNDLIIHMIAKSPDDRPKNWRTLIEKIKIMTGKGTTVVRREDVMGTEEALVPPTLRTLPKIKARILVIDDEERMRDLIVKALPTDCISAKAESAMAGLSLVQSFRPDLILLDLNMPGLGGMDLLAALRRNDQHNFVRIIVVSGTSGDAERIAAYDKGADDFIAKPFNIQELRLKIYRWTRFSRYEELSQVKDEFLELVTEENASPFPGIVQLLDLLNRIPELREIPEVDAALTQVETGNEDFVMRYHLLLDYVYCRSETYPLRPKPFTVTELLEPFLNRWALAAENRNLAISISEDELQRKVGVDRAAISRVLRWIVANALEYAKKSAAIQFAALDGEKVAIDVVDDGLGFSEEARTYAFGGFQLGNMLNAPHDIGLHLSLARELMRVQRGDLQLIDPGPMTTTVRITIPFA